MHANVFRRDHVWLGLILVFSIGLLVCIGRDKELREREGSAPLLACNLKWRAASSIWRRRKRRISTGVQCPVFYIRQQMVLMQKYPHLNPESEMITLSLVRIQTNCLNCSCLSFIYTITFYWFFFKLIAVYSN